MTRLDVLHGYSKNVQTIRKTLRKGQFSTYNLNVSMFVSGTYCPEGSSQPTPCTPGSFCASDYLNQTTGLCDPGYYCTVNATVPNPTDGITGTKSPFCVLATSCLR